MTKSPNVVFACEFLYGMNNKSNKNYGKSYQEYRKIDVNDMFDYFSNPKKSVITLFDYYDGHTRGEHYNLILENGSTATKDEIERRKQNYKKYIKNSNLWKGIVSFNNDFINNNISIKNLEQRFAKEVMPQFLKYCGFKAVKDIDYVFAVHNNTKHYHIHLAFIEKKPNYKLSNGKVGYRWLGMLSDDEKNYLKRLVQLSVERDKIYSPILINVNNELAEFKKYFNPKEKNFVLKNLDEIEIEEKILKLGELVKLYRDNKNLTSNKIKYNSIRRTKLGKEILSLTRDIKRYLYNNENSLLYDDKINVDNALKSLNDYFIKIDNDNHISGIANDELVKCKEKYLDSYVSNAIINHALYKYNNLSYTLKTKGKQDKITIEDLIQELAYQNSKKVKQLVDKQRRKKVLSNYFTGLDVNSKFPNKYKIEKAVKSLNYEMNRASEEFSKLFENQNDKN